MVFVGSKHKSYSGKLFVSPIQKQRDPYLPGTEMGCHNKTTAVYHFSFSIYCIQEPLWILIVGSYSIQLQLISIL